MNRYLPSQGLAQAVLILLGVQIFLSLCSMVSSLMQVHLLTRALSGEGISDAEASLNDLREQAIGILAVVVAIISGVVFLRYLARANHNAGALGAEGLSATPGWTIGYFFVPILNLYRPYQILQEIWQASAPEAGPWKNRPGLALIGWWWGLRLIGVVVDRVSLQMAKHSGEGPDSVQNLITGTWVSFGSKILGVLGLVLAAMMIRQLQHRQEERYQTVGEPKQVQCPSCGESLGRDVLFETTCPVCGTSVRPETLPSPA